MQNSPDKIKAVECTNMKMSSGNEKKFSQVIDQGVVKDWVGIGWIPIRNANENDYLTIPEVDYD